jgi:putative transcriptional regulator
VDKTVFARYLNVTTGLVTQWQRGEKHLQDASSVGTSRIAQELSIRAHLVKEL